MPASRRPHSAPRHRRLLLGLLLAGLVVWPLLHRAPARSCPPSADFCPLEIGSPSLAGH